MSDHELLGPDERGLSDDFKISSRGTAETHEALNRICGIASQTEARSIWGRRPGKAPVINAVVMLFDQLPRDQQAKMITQGIRLLKDYIDHGAEHGTLKPEPSTPFSPKDLIGEKPREGPRARRGRR
jgi:hypothetical protein